MKKTLWSIGAGLLLVGAIVIYFAFFFVIGEGVKAGTLNDIKYKGYLFKTYEGRVIQEGIRSKTAGSIQSYEFEFSVKDEDIAEQLMLLSGKEVQLHYKEYHKPLPWRGFTIYVVDRIVSVNDTEIPE